MSLASTYLNKMRKSVDIDGLVRILDNGSATERRDAIYILGNLRSKKAITALIGLLENEEIVVRSNAAWALGELGDMRATLPLLGLLNDPCDNVRVQAAWSLGRIGDSRAIPGLRSILNDGSSSELEKNAKQAIAKIELRNNDEGFDSTVIPVVTVDVPSEMFECNYVSRVEEMPKNGNRTTVEISKDIIIRDTEDADGVLRDNARRVMLGLKRDFTGLVSIDVIFRYVDYNCDGRKSSVWLQMSTDGEDYTPTDSGDLRRIDRISDSECNVNMHHENSRTFSPRKSSHKSVNHGYPEADQKNISPSINVTPAEPPEKESVDERKIESSIELSENERSELHNAEVENKPDINQVIADGDPKADIVDSQAHLSKKQQNATPADPRLPDIKTDEKIQAAETTNMNVDSAVKLLADIGMSGMTNAASTVTQLSGHEDSSLKSQLRILPIDQMCNEITNLGDSIVLIDVGLRGEGASGKISGRMHFYLSKNIALETANELLCNSPETTVNEFTEDIISTLKETSNIFGGQYVSAISEYIGIPIVLEAPIFKTIASSEIAKSGMQDNEGKVEFALATDLVFSGGKTGRLIILLDPNSFDIIIKKLF